MRDIARGGKVTPKAFTPTDLVAVGDLEVVSAVGAAQVVAVETGTLFSIRR